MKKQKIVFIGVISVLVTLILLTTLPLAVLGVKTALLRADYDYLKTDEKYGSEINVVGVELVTQHVSCGYASIEMLSAFYGNKITEDELDAKNNGKVSTSSSNGFLKELDRSIPDKTFIKHSYVKNDLFLKEIHDSLSSGHPVAIEWAARYEGDWTLHFSVVVGLDIAGDTVVIDNPYGFTERVSIGEFLDRTSFAAYDGMPLFLTYGFAFGAFEKNTLFRVE